VKLATPSPVNIGVFKTYFLYLNFCSISLVGMDHTMSQEPDLDGIFNFLRGGGLDTETRRNQPVPNPAPENVELGDLQALRTADAKYDETSSYQSAAPERTSIEVGDERRVVKYVPRQSRFALD
jgi:hypothetical protein